MHLTESSLSRHDLVSCSSYARWQQCWTERTGRPLSIVHPVGTTSTAHAQEITVQTPHSASAVRRGALAISLSAALLTTGLGLSLIHISEPTRLSLVSRMPSSA